MKPLKITAGNDCYAKATMQVIVNGGDESEDDTSLDLRNITDHELNFVDIIGQRYSIDSYAISRQADNLVYLFIPSDMPCGLFGLELKGKWNGSDVRAYYAEVVQIVSETDDADMASETYKGLTCYSFSDRLVAPFSGVIFPYLRIDVTDGCLWADNVPDGGNFSIEDGYLTATYNDEGTSW